MFSYEELVIKPDKKIYDIICKRYDINPAEAVFLDDVTTDDVTAALGVPVVVNGPDGKDFVEAMINPNYHDGRNNGNFVYIQAYDR